MSDDAQRLQDCSDEELARQSRAGSVASFEELARRLQVPLMRFLARKFPSRRDAEDVTQETFLQAYRSLATYHDGQPFKPWIFTIAYRLAVRRGRAERITAELSSDVPDDDELPDAAAEKRERDQRIWAIARRILSPEQVMALWLHYVEDLSGIEVARVMRRSWVSVKTMLHRARNKLAPHLNDELNEPVAANPIGGPP